MREWLRHLLLHLPQLLFKRIIEKALRALLSNARKAFLCFGV